jgi:hypothetical protein
MVFWTTPGINADYMQVVDGRVCKVKVAAGVNIAPKIDNTNKPVISMGSAENNPDRVPVAGSEKLPSNACGAGDGEYIPGSPIGEIAS